MRNKKLLLLIGILLIAVVGFGTLLVRAWLTDTDETGPIELTVGDVRFTLTGSLVESPIVPGQELVKEAFVLKNNSNVDTQIRVKVTVTSEVDGEDTSDLYSITMDGWIQVDGYYYYGDTTGVVTTSTSSISLIDSLSLNGAKVGNTHATKKFTFKFLFEAKQADHVEWDDMGTIDFSTGLAK